jgi:hypothetical protein
MMNAFRLGLRLLIPGLGGHNRSLSRMIALHQRLAVHMRNVNLPKLLEDTFAQGRKFSLDLFPTCLDVLGANQTSGPASAGNRPTSTPLFR